MTKYSSCWLLFISMLMVACSETRHGQDLTEVTDYDSSVGWLHGNCLAIKNSSVSEGTKLTIVQLDDPQNVSSATVLNKAKGGEECLPLLQDRRKINIDNGHSFYSINSESIINFGIAFVGNAKNFEKYVFDYCTTTEGILYSLKRSNQNNGEDLWSGYYYLGYESQATCDTESNK